MGKTTNVDAASPAEPKADPTCGIVMPISDIDGCTAAHWLEVKEILDTSISDAGFKPRLVSDAEEVGIIQNRIVQNLYDDEIVVVDVSAKNPNVMFELGLRLAFDKPTIIVKDDKTSYSFDTSPIEHVQYRRDLRYQSIENFQAKLTEKIEGTRKKSQSDTSYSPFLGHFKRVRMSELGTEELGAKDFFLREISMLRMEMQNLSADGRRREELLARNRKRGRSLFSEESGDEDNVSNLRSEIESIAAAIAHSIDPTDEKSVVAGRVRLGDLVIEHLEHRSRPSSKHLMRTARKEAHMIYDNIVSRNASRSSNSSD